MWVPWAIFVAFLVLSPVAATAAEPTEAEMRAVYEKKAGGLTAQQQDLRQRCERREYRQGQGDPGLAMQCLGAMAGPKGVSVKSFRKIACERAEGKPGYVCDYTMALDMATGRTFRHRCRGSPRTRSSVRDAS